MCLCANKTLLTKTSCEPDLTPACSLLTPGPHWSLGFLGDRDADSNSNSDATCELSVTLSVSGLTISIHFELSGLYVATAKLFIPKGASSSLNIPFVSTRNDAFMTCVFTSLLELQQTLLIDDVISATRPRQ